MNHQKLPYIVEGWMEKIKSSVISDPLMMIKYCDKLEAHASDVKSDYLMGFSLFYRGYSCYSQGQLEDSMKYFSNALSCLLAAGDWEMAARAYNAMGNSADLQGDLSLAISYYTSGLALCLEYKSLSVEYSIWSNISNVYMSLNRPNNAIQCLAKCEQLVEDGFVPSSGSKFLVYSKLVSCHTRLGELDNAKSYLDKLKQLAQTPLSVMDQLSINVLEAELFHKIGDLQARDAAIDRLDVVQLSNLHIVDAFSELCQHAWLLLDTDKLPQCLTLLERMESVVDTPAMQKQIIELRLKYYEHIGDMENYAKMAVAYYGAMQRLEDEQTTLIADGIIAHIHLAEESAKRKEVEQHNILLRKQAEQDVLTGLNNRSKLNELAESAFQRAMEEGEPLGMEILDIDYFKEFNDNYGHQAGDECLIRVSDVFRALAAHDNVHVVRYGGDEFVIIYEKCSRREVEQFAAKLREQIYELNIKHKYSKVSDRVTISQGIFYKTPVNKNKVWDYLHGADMALYGVKNRDRNSYYIGNSFEEVQAYSCLEPESSEDA